MIFIDNENNNNQNNITDMAIYLKKFETQAAYEAAQSGLILPNVSLTVDNNTVHYNPSTPVPPTPSYESVDLDLPSGTLWAKYNVGATSETEYGNYYQYGKGTAQYAATSGDSDYSGTENPLATSADTAAQVWGGNWHMPTSAQCQELFDNTTYEYTTINGVYGGKFTATNGSGNYIFIPCAGYYLDGSLSYDWNEFDIWCSTPNNNSSAYLMFFGNDGEGVVEGDRNLGNSVRAVIG